MVAYFIVNKFFGSHQCNSFSLIKTLLRLIWLKCWNWNINRGKRWKKWNYFCFLQRITVWQEMTGPESMRKLFALPKFIMHKDGGSLGRENKIREQTRSHYFHRLISFVWKSDILLWQKKSEKLFEYKAKSWVETVPRRGSKMRQRWVWNNGKPHRQSYRPVSVLWHTLLAMGTPLFHVRRCSSYLPSFVPELKQILSHGESEGANSACSFYSMRVLPYAACHYSHSGTVSTQGPLPCSSIFFGTHAKHSDLIAAISPPFVKFFLLKIFFSWNLSQKWQILDIKSNFIKKAAGK